MAPDAVRRLAARLKTIAADPRHLGGEIRFLAILHTWEPIVPKSIASSQAVRWLGCWPRFFLPIYAFSPDPAVVPRNIT